MIHFALTGKIEEAEKLNSKMLELMSINFVESNPIPVKTALSMMGIIEESFRLPLTNIEDTNREKVEQALKNLKLI